MLLPDRSSQVPTGEAHWPGMDPANNQKSNHCGKWGEDVHMGTVPSELHGLSLKRPSAVAGQ